MTTILIMTHVEKSLNRSKVHPLVTTARPLLAKLGYSVIEAPLPINVTAISGKFLREKINNNGCCGASELIKLNACVI